MVLTYWVLERRPCWWARPCDWLALAGLSWLPSQVQSEDGGMHDCADVCRWVLPSQCIEIARSQSFLAQLINKSCHLLMWISWLSTCFFFLKLLIIWHTGVNSCEYGGVRVLMYRVKENICVCLCVRAPMPSYSVRWTLYFPFTAMLSDWSPVCQGVTCFVFSGEDCEHPRSTPYGICVHKPKDSSGEHTTIIYYSVFQMLFI